MGAKPTRPTGSAASSKASGRNAPTSDTPTGPAVFLQRLDQSSPPREISPNGGSDQLSDLSFVSDPLYKIFHRNVNARIQRLLGEALAQKYSSRTGKSSITSASRTFLNTHDADDFFNSLRAGLFRVREWNEKTTLASFELFDEKGNMSERQTAIEKDADVVVQHARETADAVLTAARDEADEQLDRTGPRSVSREAAKEVREREDEAVLAEREAADESLQRERDETARALRGLLPLERERTDRYLLTERMRSDEALSNRDDFLGIVSHDLRDLLGGIVMSASLLARGPDPNRWTG